MNDNEFKGASSWSFEVPIDFTFEYEGEEELIIRVELGENMAFQDKI